MRPDSTEACWHDTTLLHTLLTLRQMHGVHLTQITSFQNQFLLICHICNVKTSVPVIITSLQINCSASHQFLSMLLITRCSPLYAARNKEALTLLIWDSFYNHYRWERRMKDSLLSPTSKKSVINNIHWSHHWRNSNELCCVTVLQPQVLPFSTPPRETVLKPGLPPKQDPEFLRWVQMSVGPAGKHPTNKALS